VGRRVVEGRHRHRPTSEAAKGSSRETARSPAPVEDLQEYDTGDRLLECSPPLTFSGIGGESHNLALHVLHGDP
jgi:hypothetical protein